MQLGNSVNDKVCSTSKHSEPHIKTSNGASLHKVIRKHLWLFSHLFCLFCLFLFNFVSILAFLTVYLAVKQFYKGISGYEIFAVYQSSNFSSPMQFKCYSGLAVADNLPFYYQWCRVVSRSYNQQKAFTDNLMQPSSKVGNVSLQLSNFSHLLKPLEEATEFVSRTDTNIRDGIPQRWVFSCLPVDYLPTYSVTG